MSVDCPCPPCLVARSLDIAYQREDCERLNSHPSRESLEEGVARLLRLSDDVVGVCDIASQLKRFSLDDVAAEIYGTLAALADEGVAIPRVHDVRIRQWHQRTRCGACRCEIEPFDAWCPLPDCGAEFVVSAEAIEAGKVAAE